MSRGERRVLDVLASVRTAKIDGVLAEAEVPHGDRVRVEHYLHVGDNRALERDDGIMFASNGSESVSRSRGRILQREPAVMFPLGQVELLLCPSELGIWGPPDFDLRTGTSGVRWTSDTVRIPLLDIDAGVRCGFVDVDLDLYFVRAVNAPNMRCRITSITLGIEAGPKFDATAHTSMDAIRKKLRMG